MAKTSLKERITEGVFLLDGAMGTELFVRGIEAGRCNEYLNINSPELIFDIHRAYIEAGSDAVITNTFGANKYVLARHGFSDQVADINKAAAQIARKAAGDGKYVLGGLGPSGDFLEPLGSLTAEELKEAYVLQAAALSEGGVDGFIIETMTAIDETTVAIEAVKSVCGELPLFVSMAFDNAGDDFKTMMGVDVKSLLTKVVELDVDAVGFNCGTISMDDYIKLAAQYVSTVKELAKDIAIFAEANAGQPELIEDKVVYKISTEDFATAIEKIHSLGINILGGCCGTSPAYIKAVAGKL